MIEIEMYSEFDLVDSFDVPDMPTAMKTIRTELKKIAQDEGGDEAGDQLEEIQFVKVTDRHNGQEDIQWFTVEDGKIEKTTIEESEILESEFNADLTEPGWFEDLLVLEMEELDEQRRKKVTSTGQISRVRTKKAQSRGAAGRTGISKAGLRRRAKKAARTRGRDRSGQRKAQRKRDKAMRKRRQMGISRTSAG